MDGKPAEVIREYLSGFAQAEQTSCSLSEVERRNGTGAVRYTDMGFFDQDGQPSEFIRSGDCVVLRLGYEVRQRVRHPHFGVEIYTDTGTMVTAMNTWMTGCDIPSLDPGKGCAELQINGLNLMPGRYHLSLWIETVGGIVFDSLDHCAVLDVETSDFYDSGRRLDSKFGIILLPCKWKLDGVSARVC